MSEWREVALGEVLDIAHGYAFKGAHFGQGGAIRLVTPGNFYEGGGFRDRGESQKSYDGPLPDGYALSPGALILAMTEQSPGLLGSSAIVPQDGLTWLHNQRIGLVKACHAEADERFLYSLFNHPLVRTQISATASGTKVRHTSPGRIRSVRVRVPSLPAQRRIAAVLSAFDELIEINERRIEVLEDLARSLYREWFVRFRFPGHDDVTFVDSDLGSIPEGWRASPASEVFQVNPRVRTDQTSFPKVAMADVDERYSHVLPSATVERPSGSRFERDDVLMARITPCLENGKTGLVKFLEPNEVAVGSTEFVVIRRRRVGPAFVYCAARSDHLRRNAVNSMSGASGRQRIASNCFDTLSMVEPEASIAERFEGAAGPMLEEVFERQVQNQALAATRDLLLPRLVTGRLDISDIDLGDLLSAEAA